MWSPRQRLHFPGSLADMYGHVIRVWPMEFVKAICLTSGTCLFLQTVLWKWRRAICKHADKTIPSREKSNRMSGSRSSIRSSHPTSLGHDFLLRDESKVNFRTVQAIMFGVLFLQQASLHPNNYIVFLSHTIFHWIGHFMYQDLLLLIKLLVCNCPKFGF